MGGYQEGAITGKIAASVHTLKGKVQMPNTAEREHYTGPCQATPSASQQVLHTKGLVVDEDIVVKAIPSNYGLITYNGISITVS